MGARRQGTVLHRTGWPADVRVAAFQPGGQGVDPAAPVPPCLARVSSTPTGGSGLEYVISSDGQRFLVNTHVEQNGAPITLILNHASPKD